MPDLPSSCSCDFGAGQVDGAADSAYANVATLLLGAAGETFRTGQGAIEIARVFAETDARLS